MTNKNSISRFHTDKRRIISGYNQARENLDRLKHLLISEGEEKQIIDKLIEEIDLRMSLVRSFKHDK